MNLAELYPPGRPFRLTAVWPLEDGGQGIRVEGPGGSQEFALGGYLASQVSLMEPAELPIDLILARDENGWHFRLAGSPPAPTPASSPATSLAEHVTPGPIVGTPPQPQTPEQLSEGARALLRESLGLGPDDPIPLPQGQLPTEERPESPQIFDPTPHMDLSAAEAPPLLPPPAPPGPTPPANAQTGPALGMPPPRAEGLGAFGDKTVPFAH